MANSNTKCSNERKIREEIVSDIIDGVVRKSWYMNTQNYYRMLYNHFTNGNATIEHTSEGIVFRFKMDKYGETISKVNTKEECFTSFNRCIAVLLCKDSSSDPAVFRNVNTQPLHYTINLELFPKDMILRLYSNLLGVKRIVDEEVEIKDIDLRKAKSVEVKVVFSYNTKYSSIGFINNLKDGGDDKFNKLVHDLSSEFNASLFKKIYFDLHIETSIFEKYHLCGSLYSKEIYRSFGGYTDTSKVGILRMLDKIIGTYISGSETYQDIPRFNFHLHGDVLSVAPINLAVDMLNAKSHILRNDGRFIGIPYDNIAVIDVLKELPFMWELEKYRESENPNNNISTCIVKKSMGNGSVSERYLYVSVPMKSVKRYFNKIDNNGKHWVESDGKIIPETVIPVFYGDPIEEHNFPGTHHVEISSDGKYLVAGYSWVDTNDDDCRNDAQALEEMFFNA